jgi:hypothetical protein
MNRDAKNHRIQAFLQKLTLFLFWGIFDFRITSLYRVILTKEKWEQMRAVKRSEMS